MTAAAPDNTELDRKLEALRWWNELRKSNNDHFMPLFLDMHRFLVLCGGGGSGKSIFAGRKVLERVTSEPGHRFLVCRKVDRTLRQSCFAQLKAQAYRFYADEVSYIPQGNSSDMYIKLKNGSEILFSGLDNVEKLKSIYDVTGIWIEEASELTEADFNQLDIRMRTDFPFYLQIILSFNPIFIGHWLNKRFFKRTDERAKTDRSNYLDNRFLTAEAVKTLEGFKDTDEYFYTVYCLGEWGVTGRTVFNAQALSERLAELERTPEVKRTGFFEFDESGDGVHISSIRWVDDENGPIRIYKEPEPGRPYVIGGDTAGDGSDYFVGQVLDNVSGAQVCTLRHQYEEDTYSRQMFCLGRYYNDALLGIEVNFSTYPVKLLQLMGYKNLYVREIPDEYTGALRRSFGFRTSPVTRPLILGELVKRMRDTEAKDLSDQTTISEMLTFIRNDKLRAEAAEGEHDDTVMALAIAHHIRPQMRETVLTQEEGTARWTADMWEDYRAAGPEERAYLLKKWGAPEK